MTATVSANLFSPDKRRERVVDWQAPGPAAKAAAGMSGLEAMCAIRDGLLPEPPMARLIDFRLRVAEPGRIVMELDPHESLENTIGLLHGATAAALLDTAMGCAISTMLPAGQGDQARPPDQLHRRLRPRRFRESCGTCNRDLLDDRNSREIDAAFSARNCYYMTGNIQ
jgi:acyl-coenzyme A thioesterase PaaI-like protein